VRAAFGPAIAVLAACAANETALAPPLDASGDAKGDEPPAEASGDEPPAEAALDAGADQSIPDDASCGDPVLMGRFEACSSRKDPASCAALGGQWTQLPLTSTVYKCACQTGQAGCPCTKGSTCRTDHCLADIPDGSHSCDGVTSGTCQASSFVVGSYCMHTGAHGFVAYSFDG
jgi:hypothetical protein